MLAVIDDFDRGDATKLVIDLRFNRGFFADHACLAAHHSITEAAAAWKPVRNYWPRNLFRSHESVQCP